MKRYIRMPQSEIRNGSMSLTAVQPEHIESIRQWRNEQMDVLRQAHPISPDEQATYFERMIWPDMDSSTPRQILVSIHLNSEFIGYGGIVHLSWTDMRGEVSFLIRTELMKDPATVDRLFSDYLTLIKQLAFRDLGLRRLSTETFAHRTDIIPLLERNGFVREGRMREHVLVNGVPTDSLIHGCLAHDEP
jgi:RimJ/RimL family protein N-acetyltransferase